MAKSNGHIYSVKKKINMKTVTSQAHLHEKSYVVPSAAKLYVGTMKKY